MRIAVIGAKNQGDSRQSRSVIIAIFRTHNPLVQGSNPFDRECATHLTKDSFPMCWFKKSS